MGQRGSCLLVSLLVLSLAVESQSRRNRRNVDLMRPCFLNNIEYYPGHFHTFPGLTCDRTLRCEIDGWKLYLEGCMFMGVCYPAHSTFTEGCRTRTCSPSTANGNIAYELVTISRLCEDHYGDCHDSSRLITRHGTNGAVLYNCNCTLYSDSVWYNCPQ